MKARIITFVTLLGLAFFAFGQNTYLARYAGGVDQITSYTAFRGIEILTWAGFAASMLAA